MGGDLWDTPVSPGTAWCGWHTSHGVSQETALDALQPGVKASVWGFQH